MPRPDDPGGAFEYPPSGRITLQQNRAGDWKSRSSGWPEDQRTTIIVVVLARASRLVAVITFMITARQSRAARALLGWNQETLADKARVSLTALKRLESESGLRVYESTRDQVKRALEGNGIVLLTTDKGEGVMVMRNAIAEDGKKRP